MSKVVDTTKKIECDHIWDGKNAYVAQNGQAFYFSPSKKMIHLMETLPNDRAWIAKSWRTKNIIIN